VLAKRRSWAFFLKLMVAIYSRRRARMSLRLEQAPDAKALPDLQSWRGLRICHLGKFYPPARGGMESHLQTLARAQAALGAEVRVVCVNHRDRDGRDVTWQAFTGTPTVEDEDGAVRVTRVGRRASLARLEVCLKLPWLLTALQYEGVDVMHLHVPNPTMLLPLAAVRQRVPLVITYHSDVISQKRLRRLVRPFEHMVFRRATAILPTSPAYPAGSELLQCYRDRWAVLPFGIDLRSYLEPGIEAAAEARRLREQHGEPLWLAVGRLVYYKGLHNAVEALRRVPGKLMIVGEGPLGSELRAQVSRAGLATRVIWAGRLSEAALVGAYQAATALWFPSNARSEAFGLVQVEAMASGCPVINTAIPHSGVAWVSRHEETGLTVPPNDPDALAAAANRLLAEPGLRQRLQTAAKVRACREFDARVMAARSLELYRGVAFGNQEGAAPKGNWFRPIWSFDKGLTATSGREVEATAAVP
jgi:glycosyltransferase involved in cell wall biosynthesis